VQSRKFGSELINSFVAPETVYGRALLLSRASGELAVNVAVVVEGTQTGPELNAESTLQPLTELQMAGEYELGHRYPSDMFAGLAGAGYGADRLV